MPSTTAKDKCPSTDYQRTKKSGSINDLSGTELLSLGFYEDYHFGAGSAMGLAFGVTGFKSFSCEIKLFLWPMEHRHVFGKAVFASHFTPEYTNHIMLRKALR